MRETRRCGTSRLLVVAATVLGACSAARDGAGAGPDLSDFSLGTPLVGRVLENDTGCQVDALCFLRLELADTTVAALYGLGERGTPSCLIPAEVSNRAFDQALEVTVEVVLSPCGDLGVYIDRFVDPGGDEPVG